MRSDVGEWQQGHIAGAFDSSSKVLLVSGAGAGRSAADDLAAIVDISSQAGDIFVVNKFNFIFAEMTYFSMSLSSKFSHFFPPVKINGSGLEWNLIVVVGIGIR